MGRRSITGARALRQHPAFSTPSVSVLTPSLNGGAFLADAMHSVARQADSGVEHLVLDGCSRDDTTAVAARFPHAQLVVRADEGSHDAMNHGVRAASGDIVCFVNSDDVLLDGAIAQARELFGRNPNLMLAHGRAGFYEADAARHFRFARALQLPRGDDLLRTILFGVPCLNAWFFRRSLFERLVFDITFAISADRRFLAAAIHGHEIGRIDAPVYAYRVHGGSGTMARRPDVTAGIAREHIRMARMLRQESAAADPRHALAADLLAFEHARLAKAEWERGDRRAAAQAVRAGLASSLDWPLRLARTIHLRRRLLAEATVGGECFPGELPSWTGDLANRCDASMPSTNDRPSP